VKKLFVLASALVASAAMAGDHSHHWSYTGKDGPDHWGQMEGFGLCSSGKHQSPVDVRDAVTAKLAPLAFRYSSTAREVLNNGHTVQITFAPGSQLRLASQDYELKQFHFHAPSENLLDGKRFPLEVHFVHADASGNLAVVGVFFEQGAANAALDKLGKRLPVRAGEHHRLKVKLDAAELMPESREYYRFSGSLTTPPCSEGVNWLVLKQTVTASEQQIKQFEAAMGSSNARPVQPLNGRVIEQ
jgi:carbonic anhydrase